MTVKLRRRNREAAAMGDLMQKWNDVATHAWQIKKALDQIELAKMNAERAKIGLEPIRPW